LSEAARLAGIEVSNISQMKEAAEAIHVYGARAVLIRADRLVDDEWVDIFFEGGEHQFLFRKTAQPEDVRAGRDLFAAAVVAYLAQGRSLREAIEQAQQFESRSAVEQRGKPA
jgi:hydroxymethylpyrimidine/phosphomethylpyrimidine kinase